MSSKFLSIITLKMCIVQSLSGSMPAPRARMSHRKMSVELPSKHIHTYAQGATL